MERISVTLQLALFVVVVGVLVVTMLVMAKQNEGFARVAEDRAHDAVVEAEDAAEAALRTERAVNQLMCVLVIQPVERTSENLLARCGTVLDVP